jgi:hypothetical protein
MVRIGGRPAETTVDDGRFAALVPATLPPGVYAVDADVAGLARFTDVFEVVP